MEFGEGWGVGNLALGRCEVAGYAKRRLLSLKLSD